MGIGITNNSTDTDMTHGVCAVYNGAHCNDAVAFGSGAYPRLSHLYITPSSPICNFSAVPSLSSFSKHAVNTDLLSSANAGIPVAFPLSQLK